MESARSRQLQLLSNLERQSFTQLLLLERVIPRVSAVEQQQPESYITQVFAALHRAAFYGSKNCIQS